LVGDWALPDDDRSAEPDAYAVKGLFNVYPPAEIAVNSNRRNAMEGAASAAPSQRGVAHTLRAPRLGASAVKCFIATLTLRA